MPFPEDEVCSLCRTPRNAKGSFQRCTRRPLQGLILTLNSLLQQNWQGRAWTVQVDIPSYDSMTLSETTLTDLTRHWPPRHPPWTEGTIALGNTSAVYPLLRGI